MAAHYLEFERPIADLESKIEELSRLSETANPGAFDAEIEALRARAQEMRREAYSKLDAWQKTQVARHPDRPHFVDYAAGLIDEFVELRGDRKFADDQAIMGGLGRFRGRPVVVMGHEKGRDTTT
ncbi:MAG: acetyl-CoA carboxylase carboxyl transferase subunit alpha, partial [Phenylobacterium sp.]